jgi:hypothetical protein
MEFLHDRAKKMIDPDFLGFLHRHPDTELKHNLGPEHVVVDRKDWEQAREKYAVKVNDVKVNPVESPCPPHNLEDKDDYFVCTKCKKIISTEDVLGD